MTRTFRCNHENVNARWRNNLLEVDIETMCEGESTARLEIGTNFFLVDVRLLLVRNQDHRDVCLLDRLSDRQNLEVMRLGSSLGLRTLVKTDDDIDAAFLEVQCMCMSLAAVADDGNGLALHNLPVHVLIIISFCHSTLSPHNFDKSYALHAPGRSAPCESFPRCHTEKEAAKMP